MPELVHKYNVTPHATTGFPPYYLLYRVQPHLPIDALLGGEEVSEGKQDWLSVHQERLRYAHEKARKYSEEKALERVTRLNAKAFCPQVCVGELVYLCQRFPGRNKIQDAWSPIVYRVVEIIGTTYTVEPLDGGPSKRVHRSELRPGAVPTPRPRGKDKSQPDTQHVTRYENDTSEPDFIVLEEVVQPSLRGATDTSPDSEAPGNLELGGDNSEGNQVPISGGTVGDSAESDGEGRRAETADETVQSQEFETSEIYGRVHTEVPVPAVRRNKRATAGVHTNPFHAPRSACNAVSVSTDMVSQVLTSIGTALFEKELQGAMNTEFISESSRMLSYCRGECNQVAKSIKVSFSLCIIKRILCLFAVFCKLVSKKKQ